MKCRILAIMSMMFCGAIFGFFYAWTCSTMWGLDMIDPRVAIRAMQAMNASVRNPVFALAFFGTPVVLGITTIAFIQTGSRNSAYFFGLAAFAYLAGCVVLTAIFNVPMNEALAQVIVSENIAEATNIWADYSSDWQFWNHMRTIISGFSFLLVGLGMQSAMTSPDRTM